MHNHFSSSQRHVYGILYRWYLLKLDFYKLHQDSLSEQQGWLSHMSDVVFDSKDATYINDRIQYFTGLQKFCTDKTMNEQAKEEIAKNIITYISKSDLFSPKDALKLLEAVKEAKFDEVLANKILSALHSKTAITEIDDKAEPSITKQSHKYFENYMTKEEWETLCNDDHALSAKIYVVAKAIIRCGWFVYSEPDLANVVVIFRCLGLAAGPAESLDVLRELKNYLKKARDNPQGCKNKPMISVFPNDPKELPNALRMIAFSSGDLVQSPLDLSLIHI